MTRPQGKPGAKAGQGLRSWLELRLGPEAGASRRYRGRQVPAPQGWPQYFHRCLGGLCLVLLMVQLASGLFLLMHYRPEPGQALASLMRMEAEAWGGWGLRRAHAVAGSLLLLGVSLHMLRVLVRGAYRGLRELNWLSGLALWLGSLAMLISGGLLPATQPAWRGLGLLCQALGLEPPGLEGLGLAYGLHLALPWLMLLALWAHLAMVRRLGVSGPL